MTSRRQVLRSGAVVFLAGALAGCLSDSEADSEADGEFALERVVLSSEDPDTYDSYEDVPDERTFTVDEPFWVLVAVEYAPTDEDGAASLDYSFPIEAPDGSTLQPVRERSEQWEDVESNEVLIVWEKFSTFPEDQPGEYELRLAVKDQVEGQRLRTDEPFTLENGDGSGEQAEHEFGVEKFVYTTDRARAFGEYTPNTEEVYRDGETVWMYIEVSNVTPVPGGPRLTSEWTLLGPDGEEVVSREESVRFPDSLGELPNEGFLTQGIDTSRFELPASGEYTTKVTLTDRKSGESVELSRPVTLHTLQFDAVVFTDGEPDGVDEYDVKPDATYAPGEDVWLYTEVSNAPVDDSGKAILKYVFEVVPPEGDPWDPIETRNKWERVQDDEYLVYWRGFRMYEDDPTGEYQVTVTVDDRVTRNKQIQTTETFVVE